MESLSSLDDELFPFWRHRGGDGCPGTVEQSYSEASSRSNTLVNRSSKWPYRHLRSPAVYEMDEVDESG